MAESFVQVATDGAGKQIDTFTSGTGSTHRQAVVLGDSETASVVKIASPTDADAGDMSLSTESYLKGFNGTTWDRLRSTTANGLAADVTRVQGTVTIQGVQDTSTTGSIVAATTVVGPLSVIQRNVITVSVHGAYAGVTFIIEASDDAGSDWYPLQCINNATGQVGSTWTPGTNASASYDSATGGYNQLRVRATAWTSGSAVVSMTGQAFAYDPVVGAVVNGVDGTGVNRVMLLNPTGLQPVTLGNSQGKVVKGTTGALVTTAATADQVIATYTVTAGKTLYLLGASVSVRLTTYATTATNFGFASLELPSGAKINTQDMAHAGVIWPPPSLLFPEPLPVAAGTVVRWVCTPSGTTSFTWRGNLWGYEV